MRGLKAKRLRKENGPKPDPILTNPTLIEYKGKSVYIPRKQRRALMQRFKTDLKKGRIDMDTLNERIKQGDWKSQVQ